MRRKHWPPSIAVAIVLCASLALAAPAPADTTLRRDGTEAEKFVADPVPASGIVLRRDGSRAQPYAPGTAPVREPGQGLGLGSTAPRPRPRDPRPHRRGRTRRHEPAAQRRSPAAPTGRSRLTAAAQPTRPGTQSVPASGTLAIAAASSVSATMSSGSRLWTWDLPQARARVWASSTIARR